MNVKLKTEINYKFIVIGDSRTECVRRPLELPRDARRRGLERGLEDALRGGERHVTVLRDSGARRRRYRRRRGGRLFVLVRMLAVLGGTSASTRARAGSQTRAWP